MNKMANSSVWSEDMVRRAKDKHLKCNIFLLLVGAVVLSMSIAAKTNTINVLTVLNHYESQNMTVTIAFSAVLILIGAIGVFASFRFSATYFVVNGLLLTEFLVASIGYIAWILISTNYSVNGSLFQQLDTELRNYENHQDSVNSLQSTLSCCGVNGYTDWKNSSSGVPSSCCKSGGPCNINSSDIAQQGCFVALRVLLVYVGLAIIASITFISLVEIVAIALVMPLRRAAKKMVRRKPTEDLEIKIPRVRGIWTISKEEEVEKTTHPNVDVMEESKETEKESEEIVISEKPTRDTETDAEKNTNDRPIKCIVLNFF